MQQPLITAAFGALILFLGYVWHSNTLQKAVDEARSGVKQKYEATYVEGLVSSLNASNDLLKDANTRNKEMENERANIAKRHAGIVAGLQHRLTRAEATRPSNPTAPAPEACTGAQLPREDAEFLAGEAARAERILKERDDLYERYERARQALEAFQRAPSGRIGEVSNPKPIP